VEFLEHIKVDLFPDEVYVFSPKGKIFALPKGATPIDFAYAVHTEVGNHCIAAKVTARRCRSAPCFATATASRSSPIPRRGPTRSGSRTWPPARPARTSAIT
jgi:Guanosine polyphosphate pyrophosphohydrolases/synthetases